MLHFLMDEDFDGRHLGGILRRRPGLDIVRVQDVGLRTREDTVLLAWAAKDSRLMPTHDSSTVPDEAYRRVESGLAMPGVVVINKNLPLGQNIDDIVLSASASAEGEWENRAIHLPL